MSGTHVGTIAGCLLMATASTAEIVYDDLESGTDGVAWAGDLVIDDLHVEGGGVVQSVGVVIGTAGPATMTDVTLILALDGGDGVPDVDGTGDDWILFQATVSNVSVPDGGTILIGGFSLADRWAVIPPGALVFGGVMISNPNVGHVFYGVPTIGTTDEFVWSFAQMGPTPVPSVGNPKLSNSDALAFRIEVAPLPGPAPGNGVIGDAIDFESLAEGFQGTSLTTGGVTLFNGRDGFPPPIDATITIDDGTGVWEDNPSMLDYVQGKLLQLNVFSDGPDGYAFAILKSIELSSGREHTGARVSVAYVSRIIGDTDFAPSTITLLAMLDGEMVATDVVNADRELGQSSGGSFTFGAATLEISGVTFDSLVLFNNGPGPFGAVQMGLDNVILGRAACSGDVDLDDEIGFDDLVAVLANWGPCPPSPECPADLDGDGEVGFADVVEVLANWGPCERE